MHRPTVGAISLVLVLLGLVLWALDPQSASPGAAACFRVAIVMAILWLALPQLATLPRWARFVTFGAVAVVCWRPKALIFAVPVLIVLAIARPRLRQSVGP